MTAPAADQIMCQVRTAQGHASRSCIIVSPYFPPSSVAGVHRARHMAKHLPSAGWVPTVLCVDERFHEERLDPELAGLVPADVEIVRTAAIPARLTRRFGAGELSLRAYLPLRRALFRLLETRPVGVVFITGSPYYPMLLAPAIRRRFGVPVVLDFQDPWMSEWGAAQPRLSKIGASHALAAMLEPKALRGAAFVTSVSAIQNRQLAGRYPWLDAERMADIPIGSDPEDFKAVASSVTESAGALSVGKVNVSYVGTVLPRAAPLFEVLLRAVARMRAEQPELAARIRFNFIGSSNQADEFRKTRVRPAAETEGVGDLVHELPQRIPYVDALRVLGQSDGLLMIGSDEPHYTASKIYPGLMSGTPFLSIFHRSSSAHKILSEAGGGLALAFSTPAELAALEPLICEGLVRLATAPQSFGRPDAAVYEPYTARAVAERFGDIFDRLDAERRGAGGCA